MGFLLIFRCKCLLDSSGCATKWKESGRLDESRRELRAAVGTRAHQPAVTINTFQCTGIPPFWPTFPVLSKAFFTLCTLLPIAPAAVVFFSPPTVFQLCAISLRICGGRSCASLCCVGSLDWLPFGLLRHYSCSVNSFMCPKCSAPNHECSDDIQNHRFDTVS